MTNEDVSANGFGDTRDPVIAVKLMVSDLDGTLLTPAGTLSERTKQAIVGIRKSGVRFTLATARSARDAVAFAKLLDVSDPVICQNGAVIYSQELSRMVRWSLLPRPTLIRIVADLRRFFGSTALAIDYPLDRLVDPSWEGPVGSNPTQATLWPIGPHEVPNRRAATVLLYDAPTEAAEHFGAYPELTVTTSARRLIEIGSKHADKGLAVERLCRLIDVPVGAVVAIGDMPNDLGMLARSGFGVAVENADAVVRHMADYVTKSNREDGVASFIETLLSG